LIFQPLPASVLTPLPSWNCFKQIAIAPPTRFKRTRAYGIDLATAAGEGHGNIVLRSAEISQSARMACLARPSWANHDFERLALVHLTIAFRNAVEAHAAVKHTTRMNAAFQDIRK
jgi:hypothetical protein